MAGQRAGRGVPIVFLDGIVFKVRKDGRVINKCVYSARGSTWRGRRDLGIWMSKNESASFWTTVCNELKNRGWTFLMPAGQSERVFGGDLGGVLDGTAAVRDSPDRNSTKFIAIQRPQSRDGGLKEGIWRADAGGRGIPSEHFQEVWGTKPPANPQVLGRELGGAVYVLQIPPGGPRADLHDQRGGGIPPDASQFTKTKSVYPTDDSIRKSIYLSIQEITKNGRCRCAIEMI